MQPCPLRLPMAAWPPQRCCCLCSPLVLADRPLVSETADVIGGDQCQIETGLAQPIVATARRRPR